MVLSHLTDAGSSGVYTFAFSLRDARALAKNVLNNMNAPCDGEILSKCLLSYNYNPQRLRGAHLVFGRPKGGGFGSCCLGSSPSAPAWV